MSTYTASILISCLYANDKGRLSTYKEIATTAFGSIGGWITFFFNSWILLGVPVLYLVLGGNNINQLAAGTAAEIGHVPWTIICAVAVAIPLVLVKTMKEVAWLSAFSTVTIFIVVIIVLVMCAVDKPNQINIHHDGVIWDMFPIALSTISFSFGGNVVYPHVEAAMKKPKDWNKVAAAGLGTCVALYYIIAVCGYLVYGDRVNNPIYNSIPDGAPKIIAIVVITLNVLATAPLLMTSFSLDIEEMFNITVERHGKIKEFFLRSSLRLATTAIVAVVACVVPHFGALMSLIGAFANCTPIFLFPVILYLKLTGIKNKKLYELAWCFLVCLMGVVGLVFGTMEAIKELISAYGF
ncbi:hypothetical protein [Parasitella parasitica]|uniref:Amino acid transporter transmembrane domain-containing protein n=1 Tax=Parasitella parasitica TaxID=35722 RepID=A0A0B7NDG3_9FUNG|nr:hypothetical protein [Parasitella parasitica]